MRTPFYWRLSSCICLAAVLAACGNPIALTPRTGLAAGSPSQSAPASKAQNLLYISDLGANAVVVYNYPAATPVGKLTGFGSVAGLCSNTAGNVFVVDEAGPVDVYAHGGSNPIRRLETSGATYGCSVDPTSGDLAVTELSAYQYGAIAVYAKAKGKPTFYKDKNIDATWFCGYDASGNLFADAWDRYANVVLLELPKHGKAFKWFKLGQKFNKAGGVAWDGKYVTVGNFGDGVVYRVSEAGHVAQTVTLRRGANVEQFWLAGSTLVGPNAQNPGSASFWRYPAGGSPYKTISGLTFPFGATISYAR